MTPRRRRTFRFASTRRWADHADSAAPTRQFRVSAPAPSPRPGLPRPPAVEKPTLLSALKARNRPWADVRCFRGGVDGRDPRIYARRRRSQRPKRGGQFGGRGSNVFGRAGLFRKCLRSAERRRSFRFPAAVKGELQHGFGGGDQCRALASVSASAIARSSQACRAPRSSASAASPFLVRAMVNSRRSVWLRRRSINPAFLQACHEAGQRLRLQPFLDGELSSPASARDGRARRAG